MISQTLPGSCCAAIEPRQRCQFGVKSLPADHVIYRAEDLQKADGIAAAPRTENVCQELPKRSFWFAPRVSSELRGSGQ
jgi:hypothetical protein